MPTVDEVVARCAEQVDRDPDDLGWFCVLACHCLGIICSHARRVAALTPADIGDRLHTHTLDLVAQAAELVDAGS